MALVTIEGKIKSKQRPRFSKKSGRAFTPDDTVQYENWIKICYQQQNGKYLEGPIRANIVAYFEIPKSYSKKKIKSIHDGSEYPNRKIDADNICKIVLDSLNGIAYYDDNQVVEVTVLKRYTDGIERLEIELQEIRGD